jgi:hypothetical protein
MMAHTTPRRAVSNGCARDAQAILYLTSVGEPSGVYETVKVDT